MDIIKISYIDDNPDTTLSRYLDENYNRDQNNIKYKYEEFRFELTDNDEYKDFLNSDAILEYDIILIDSKLFQNSEEGERYTGDQIKIIIKNLYPFKELIIISQNDPINDYDDRIKKYSERNYNSAEAVEYYNKNLKPTIKKAINNILNHRNSFKEIYDAKIFDKALIDNLKDSIENTLPKYKELTNEKIDEIIKSFNEIKEIIDK